MQLSLHPLLPVYTTNTTTTTPITTTGTTITTTITRNLGQGRAGPNMNLTWGKNLRGWNSSGSNITNILRKYDYYYYYYYFIHHSLQGTMILLQLCTTMHTLQQQWLLHTEHIQQLTNDQVLVLNFNYAFNSGQGDISTPKQVDFF